METLPFIEEEISENVYIRTFSEDTPEKLLKWHWDNEDRIIEPIGHTEWEFQIDNDLPKRISSTIYIPRGEWHRIIKGPGELKLKIQKIKDA